VSFENGSTFNNNTNDNVSTCSDESNKDNIIPFMVNTNMRSGIHKSYNSIVDSLIENISTTCIAESIHDDIDDWVDDEEEEEQD
jgi:nitrogenase molybdenum-iron protein alpha/beta subunit